MVDCDRLVKSIGKWRPMFRDFYAAGDCTQTFLRQVVTSAADGAVAAVASGALCKGTGTDTGESQGRIRAGTIFLFYNPYSNEGIEKTAQLEQELSGQWRVFRQDVTKQEPALQQPEAGTDGCGGILR